MEIIFQLYGTLILTLIGFVLPVLAIVLAMLPEGVNCLSTKYENEKKQAEDNLINEIKKKKEGNDLNEKQIETTIRILKNKKKEAIKKLSYLEPKKLILRIFFPFLLSLLILIFIIKINGTNFKVILLFFSLLSFFAGLIALWKSIIILIEVSDAVNKKSKNNEEKIIELLSTIADKGDAERLFLKEGEIRAKFNGVFLKKGEELEFSINKQYEIPAAVNNSGEFMAKNVEVGFIVPKDFLIENSSNISVYAGETNQVIRLNNDIVQAHENLQNGKIKITFLKPGNYPIETFIKGENVKYQKFIFKIKVIE